LGAVGSPAGISLYGAPFVPAPTGYFAELSADTSSSATRCDYYRDGELDLVVCGSRVRIYRNDAVSPAAIGPVTSVRRTVTVRFVGDASAPFAVPRDGQGTRVRLVIQTGILAASRMTVHRDRRATASIVSGSEGSVRRHREWFARDRAACAVAEESGETVVERHPCGLGPRIMNELQGFGPSSTFPNDSGRQVPTKTRPPPVMVSAAEGPPGRGWWREPRPPIPILT
jgi:hypothetical protein